MIDAHFHLWRIGRNDCSWPTPQLAAIHRDFEIDDWWRAAAPLGVASGVLVQSQESDRDTDWLLELAAGDDRVAAVVGWVDFSSRDAPQRIATLAAHPKLRGLRPMLQGLAEDGWILRRELAPAIDAMIAHGLRFDALVKPRHLPHLLRFAQQHPDLQIVIDHAAKPDIANGVLEPWRAQMAEIAALPNVFCKLSGLLTEAGERGASGLRPYVDHLLQTFGPRRLLWGSDWPVLNLAGDYARWFRLADALTGLNDAERAAVFGGNAARFYRLRTADASA
ncbi:MAG TPA: amidohydrolase family protein [Rhodanobacteraceae bacterium]|nr:amidohydrolase family protein [Rhodanobacteraceae bacterium]